MQMLDGAQYSVPYSYHPATLLILGRNGGGRNAQEGAPARRILGQTVAPGCGRSSSPHSVRRASQSVCTAGGTARCSL
eukprot:946415-Prymnesium_polylepis.1